MLEISWYNPNVGTPIVTVAVYGLTFNEAAINEINNPPFVRIGYVKDKRWIVIQPLQSEEEDAFSFNSKKRDRYIRVQSRDFIRFVILHHELNLERAVRIPALWSSDLGMLVVDLTKAEVDADSDDSMSE